MSNKPRDRRELGFFDHIEELRMRIIRSVIYIAAGSAAGWFWRHEILTLLQRPAQVGAQRVGIDELTFRVFEPVAGFMIAIQVAMLAGVIIAAPLILWEVWRFIEPALEEHERGYAIIMVPFASLLFLGGVAFCYFVSPNAFAFLFKMDLSLGVEVERTLKPYLWFMMRLLLAFGLAFELPLVLMFLGFIGVVNSRQLLLWWRHAVVVMFVFAAIVTPTVDPVNMTILAVPLMMLYMLSVGLVHLVQKSKGTVEEEPEEVEYTIEHPADAAPDDSYAVYEEAQREAEEFYQQRGIEEPSEAGEPDEAADDEEADAGPER